MSTNSVGLIHPVNECRDHTRSEIRFFIFRRAWPSIGINLSFLPTGLQVVVLGFEIVSRECRKRQVSDRGAQLPCRN